MEFKKVLLRNIPLIWIVLTTTFGTIFEFFLKPKPEPHPIGPIIFGWFLMFGVIPSIFIYLIINLKRIKEKLFASKKFAIGTIVIFLTIVITGNLFLYKRFNMWLWEIIGSSPLSEREIQEKAKHFTRNYPKIIKGSWEPNEQYMGIAMVYDSNRLKKLGVNTVSVEVGCEFNKDGSCFGRDEERFISNIVRAKENGFAVQVVVNFVGAYGHDFKKEGIQITKEEYLRISDELALKWAKIAEKYKVEFFCPQSEIDFIVQSNFAGEGSVKEGKIETARIIADWHKQILPKIKEVFKGKTLVEFSWIDEEKVDTAEQYIGYDYIGTGISHNNRVLEEVRVMISGQYSKIADMAKSSNSSWFVKEAWFPYGGPFYPATKNVKGESLDELQDDYYRISIEEYLKFTSDKPAGYIFHSWRMLSAPIKDRPAEKVLKEFYSKI